MSPAVVGQCQVSGGVDGAFIAISMVRLSLAWLACQAADRRYE